MKVEATGATDYMVEVVKRIDQIRAWLPGGQMFLTLAFALQFAVSILYLQLVVAPVWGPDAPFMVEAFAFVPILLSIAPALAAISAGRVEDLFKAIRASATAIRYSPAASGDVTVDMLTEGR